MSDESRASRCHRSKWSDLHHAPLSAARLAALFLWLAALIAPAPGAPAAEAPTADAREVSVHFFWRKGCPHCERESEFLRTLTAAHPDIRVHSYEIGGSEANRDLLGRVIDHFNPDRVAVPFTVVGDKVWIGYLDDRTTGAEIARAVDECRAAACRDVVAALAAQRPPERPMGARTGTLPETIRLPLLGEVRTADLSLPALTIVLGALDGFNPCAMWTLVFLIGLLLGMRDHARMWALGSAFIIASAAVYFLFMAAWLNVFLMLGMVLWIRLAVGAVAMAGGAYYLRQFVTRRDEVCEVTADEGRRRVFDRLKAIAQEKSFALALGGVVLLAFAVNLVELICSAGIPAVYTQLLAMSALPAWQHYALILLYIFVFMLDDLIVFVAAMTTLQVSGLTGRYSRYSHLIGGVVLLVLGVLLIAKPEWLTFG